MHSTPFRFIALSIFDIKLKCGDYHFCVIVILTSAPGLSEPILKLPNSANKSATPAFNKHGGGGGFWITESSKFCIRGFPGTTNSIPTSNRICRTRKPPNTKFRVICRSLEKLHRNTLYIYEASEN